MIKLHRVLTEVVPATAVITVAGALILLLNGYVVTVLWQWFLVPLGAPPITIRTGLGLALMWTFCHANAITPSMLFDRLEAIRNAIAALNMKFVVHEKSEDGVSSAHLEMMGWLLDMQRERRRHYLIQMVAIIGKPVGALALGWVIHILA